MFVVVGMLVWCSWWLGSIVPQIASFYFICVHSLCTPPHAASWSRGILWLQHDSIWLRFEFPCLNFSSRLPFNEYSGSSQSTREKPASAVPTGGQGGNKCFILDLPVDLVEGTASREDSKSQSKCLDFSIGLLTLHPDTSNVQSVPRLSTHLVRIGTRLSGPKGSKWQKNKSNAYSTPSWP